MASKQLAEQKAAQEKQLAQQKAAADRQLAEQKAVAERQQAEQQAAVAKELSAQQAVVQRRMAAMQAEYANTKKVLDQKLAAERAAIENEKNAKLKSLGAYKVRTNVITSTTYPCINAPIPSQTNPTFNNSLWDHKNLDKRYQRRSIRSRNRKSRWRSE